MGQEILLSCIANKCNVMMLMYRVRTGLSAKAGATNTLCHRGCEIYRLNGRRNNLSVETWPTGRRVTFVLGICVRPTESVVEKTA